MNEHALAIAGICLPSADEPRSAVVGDDVEQDQRNARKLMVWLLAHRGEVVPLRRICQRGPYAVRQADKARRALAILEGNGFVRFVPNVRLDHRLNKETWTVAL